MAHSSAKKGINKISGVPLVDSEVLFKEEAEFLSKALTKDDAPPKEKHVRSAVVATFQENGCMVFFNVVETKLNSAPFTVPIVGYKTCYLIHRLMRDGHERVVGQTDIRFKPIARRMEAGFGFRDDLGYCPLTVLYIQFITMKARFHLRHTMFPPTVREEGVRLAILDKPDVNFLFEVLSDLLDFLELQLSFTISVLNRIDPSAKLPTSHTHCVIHPLINFIPESYLSYVSVQEIFVCLARLLEADLLAGHKKRILENRKKLGSFLTASQHLSYITGIYGDVPDLPSLPRELTHTVRTVEPMQLKVEIPKRESHALNRRFSAKFDFQTEANRDRRNEANSRLIQDLNSQIDAMKSDRMTDHQLLFDANNENQMMKGELAELKRENGELKDTVAATAAAMDVSDQVAAANAKYLRLKELYTELRNGHVEMIREKAKSDKNAANMGDRVVDMEAEKEAMSSSLKAAKEEQELLQQHLRDAEAHMASVQGHAQEMENTTQEQLASLEQQLGARGTELEAAVLSVSTEQAETKKLTSQLEEARAAAAAEEAEKQQLKRELSESLAVLVKFKKDWAAESEATTSKMSTLEGERKRLASDLEETLSALVVFKKNLEGKEAKASQKVTSLEQELSAAKQEVAGMSTNVSSGQAETKKLSAELAEARAVIVTYKKDLEVKEQDMSSKIHALEKDLTEAKSEIVTTNVQFNTEKDQTKTLQEQLAAAKAESATREKKLADSIATLTKLRADMDAQLAAERQRQTDLSHSVLVQALSSAQEEVQEAGSSGTRTVAASALVDGTQSAVTRCEELGKALDGYRADHTTVPAASSAVGNLSHCLCRVIEDANAVAAANADTGMVDLTHQLAEVSLRSLQDLKIKNADAGTVSTAVSSILKVVQSMNTKAKELVPAEMKKIAEVGQSVESEMNLMAEAVMLAAKKIEEMMERSKETDTGEQLEVNSRILDSSSALMEAIRVLISESRALQKEIVESGRGALSVDQFYQKNSRWTEGLLSAAQMVGHGAQHLVECADKVVTGQGKFEELEVASHDIAASTAQLVAASQAKANQHSKQLASLKAASKVVTEQTGHVVVSAKSGVKAQKKAEMPDYTKLSAIKGKRTEMEIQVRLLELEAEVEHTRNKLGEIRRLGYSGSASASNSRGPSPN